MKAEEFLINKGYIIQDPEINFYDLEELLQDYAKNELEALKKENTFMKEQIEEFQNEDIIVEKENEALKKENAELKEYIDDLKKEFTEGYSKCTTEYVFQFEALKKENEELKAAIKKGIIRSIEDDGSLTIYWNDLTENEQDLLTETITDK